MVSGEIPEQASGRLHETPRLTFATPEQEVILAFEDETLP